MPKEEEKKLAPIEDGGLASTLEKKVGITANLLFDKRKNMLDTIGTRPYKGLPVKEEELLSRFSQIWRDPQALTEILKQNAIFKKDGRVLISKALLKKMKEMTQKLRKGGM